MLSGRTPVHIDLCRKSFYDLRSLRCCTRSGRNAQARRDYLVPTVDDPPIWRELSGGFTGEWCQRRVVAAMKREIARSTPTSLERACQPSARCGAQAEIADARRRAYDITGCRKLGIHGPPSSADDIDKSLLRSAVRRAPGCSHCRAIVTRTSSNIIKNNRPSSSARFVHTSPQQRTRRIRGVTTVSIA